VKAKSYGDLGQQPQRRSHAPDGVDYTLDRHLNGVVVETSPEFTTQQQAVDWSVATSRLRRHHARRRHRDPGAGRATAR
jgi:hypothetical protein